MKIDNIDWVVGLTMLAILLIFILTLIRIVTFGVCP